MPATSQDLILSDLVYTHSLLFGICKVNFPSINGVHQTLQSQYLPFQPPSTNQYICCPGLLNEIQTQDPEETQAPTTWLVEELSLKQ
jgi:hypothetical protein